MMSKITKIYDFFRYDIHQGIYNLIRFFPVIWKFRPWDYGFVLIILQKCLIYLSKYIEVGYEIDEDRLPKIKAIKRAIIILEHEIKDDYIKLAEQELGYEVSADPFDWEEYEHDSKLLEMKDKRTEEIKQKDKLIFDKSYKIENNEWEELKQILFGSDKIKGSNLRGWWD